MITPVNGHLIIEPIVNKEFVITSDDKYQEIGTVVAVEEGMDTPQLAYLDTNGGSIVTSPIVKKGDKVYFDAWLAKKYPKAGGKQDEFLWLVKWEHISAIERAE